METTFKNNFSFLSPERKHLFYNKMIDVVVLIETSWKREPPKVPPAGRTGSSDDVMEDVMHGAGLVLNKDGLILTAAHVVPQKAERIFFRLKNSEWKGAVVLVRDDSKDLLILKPKIDEEFHFGKLAEESEMVVEGMEVESIAHPNDLYFTWQTGQVGYGCDFSKSRLDEWGAYIEHVDRSYGGRLMRDVSAEARAGELGDYHMDLKIIQLDNLVTACGSSGSPVFSCTGVVVGVFSFTADGFSFAVHVDEVRQFLKTNDRVLKTVRKQIKRSKTKRRKRDMGEGNMRREEGKKKKKSRAMGRDVAGLRIGKQPSAVKSNSDGVSQDKVHVSPKSSGLSTESKDYEADVPTVEDLLTEECHEKLDVLRVRSESMTHDAGLPEGDTLNPEVQKSGKNKLSSPVKGNIQSNDNPQLPSAATSKQTISPQVSRKSLRPDYKKHLDEENNCSVASSYPLLLTAASVRTVKFKTPVPVAPVFRCVDHVERLKEFYSKLEEKHQALEEERNEFEARTKEEQEAAIKQLRKNLVIKAKPMPSFYQEGEGPLPKAEVKKLPFTHAKSPNLYRRKSQGDAIGSSSAEKGVWPKGVRQSLGNLKVGSCTTRRPLENKDQISGRSGNVTCKSKDRSQTVEGEG